MARPDPTPPDASLFPIAPTFTADPDARQLDFIASELRELSAWFDASPPGSMFYGTPKGVLETLDRMEEAVKATGREV